MTLACGTRIGVYDRHFGPQMGLRMTILIG
jgi:hypothetical protein